MAIAATMLGGAATPAQAAALPADITGLRFWTGDLCIDGSTIDSSAYRVGYIAQQWNLRVGNPSALSLHYEDDCIAAGYPPSRRMVIGKVNKPSTAFCQLSENTTPDDDTDTHNGWKRWTHGPIVTINIGRADCVGSQARRDHFISSAIGGLLGLQGFESKGWDSRVMNDTDFSMDHVPLPDVYSVQRVREIYTGVYGN
jgi:hypothetical protein